MRRRSRNDDNSVQLIDNTSEFIDNFVQLIDNAFELIVNEQQLNDNFSWLNVGSLVFGLIAWILPVVSLMRYKQGGHRNWASLMDTTGSLVKVSTVLLIVTIGLNVATQIMYRNRTAK